MPQNFITRSMLKEFRKDFDVTIASLREKYNIELSLGSIRFDNTTFSGKFNAILVNENNKGLSAYDATLKENLERYGDSYGGVSKCYGKVFIFKGDQYVLIGLNPRSRRTPLIIMAVLNPDRRYRISTISEVDYTARILKSNLWYDFEMRKVREKNK